MKLHCCKKLHETWIRFIGLEAVVLLYSKKRLVFAVLAIRVEKYFAADIDFSSSEMKVSSGTLRVKETLDWFHFWFQFWNHARNSANSWRILKKLLLKIDIDVFYLIIQIFSHYTLKISKNIKFLATEYSCTHILVWHVPPLIHIVYRKCNN